MDVDAAIFACLKNQQEQFKFNGADRTSDTDKTTV